MKDLISRLKQASANGAGDAGTEPSSEEALETTAPKRTEDHGAEPKTKKVRRKRPEAAMEEEGGMVRRIRSFEIGETDCPAVVHVRLPEQIHSKMIALKAKKLSVQNITVFALMRLMDEPEIKNAIKQIINDLE